MIVARFIWVYSTVKFCETLDAGILTLKRNQWFPAFVSILVYVPESVNSDASGTQENRRGAEDITPTHRQFIRWHGRAHFDDGHIPRLGGVAKVSSRTFQNLRRNLRASCSSTNLPRQNTILFLPNKKGQTCCSPRAGM